MSRGTKTQDFKPRPSWRMRPANLAVLIGFTSLATPAAANPSEAGIWFDDSGKGAVEIAPCGPKLCGRIVWLRDPLNAEGNPLVDRYNPNPARRTTPICGLQILGGLQAMPEGSWDAGWIYDPKTGSAYDAAIKLVRADQLQVTGYKGVKLFSKSFVWTRAPDDLPRCDDQAAVGAPAPEGEAARRQQAQNPPAAKAETLPWATR